MKDKYFKVFIKEYLEKFRLYYKRNTNRKELKRAVFDNPKLYDYQKEEFWRMVRNEKTV